MWLRTDIEAVADITTQWEQRNKSIFLDNYKHEDPINIQWFTN